jgi:hypothetical protein
MPLPGACAPVSIALQVTGANNSPLHVKAFVFEEDKNIWTMNKDLKYYCSVIRRFK